MTLARWFKIANARESAAARMDAVASGGELLALESSGVSAPASPEKPASASTSATTPMLAATRSTLRGGSPDATSSTPHRTRQQRSRIP
eukprot:CAMPEP_0185830904 /NCGR_PEP_ID=MMETSP1353-20130828/1156_1 /TAXON_ID=1077150 /ORGANISM="Erythrolobus australicus, Strain CCMP3124" /LENGTH=88 /DNA_ID=CAMNT_0028528897 /DNA_START=762 /DNA_END=1024 /DNA_ORIENTATION=+